MARPPKADPKPKESATVVVNINDFVRTRDSVVTGLATLQSAVQDLSRAYIAHTNTVLGRAPGTSLDLLALANPLENGLLAQRPTSPVTKSDVEEPKKKRKRAPHDPNAPKRALTPYFLYMQTARSKIASELGPSAKPKDVADEGTRRWATMPENEKKTWHVQYALNLAAYREKMKAYKAGKPVPDIDGEAAQQLLAEQQGAGLGVVDLDAASEDEEDEDEEEEPSPEPPKVATPPRAAQAKRRKTADAKQTATPAAAKEAAASAVSKKDASEKTKSPEKKKKSKKDKEADAEKSKKSAVEATKPQSEATTGREKKGRKKRKIEPAPDA